MPLTLNSHQSTQITFLQSFIVSYLYIKVPSVSQAPQTHQLLLSLPSPPYPRHIHSLIDPTRNLSFIFKFQLSKSNPMTFTSYISITFFFHFSTFLLLLIQIRPSLSLNQSPIFPLPNQFHTRATEIFLEEKYECIMTCFKSIPSLPHKKTPNFCFPYYSSSELKFNITQKAIQNVISDSLSSPLVILQHPLTYEISLCPMGLAICCSLYLECLLHHLIIYLTLTNHQVSLLTLHSLRSYCNILPCPVWAH